MHHRRLVQDDNKGVVEILNESDQYGFGIKTSAKYYVHIYDTKKGHSKQRQQQIRTENPLQYFFAFTYDEAESFAKKAPAKTAI